MELHKLTSLLILLLRSDYLSQCFQNLCARRPLLTSKSNHGFSYSCSRKYGMYGWYVQN